MSLIQTLGWACVVIGILGALGLRTLSMRVRNAEGAKEWTLSFCLFALSMAAVLLRGPIPFIPSVLLSNLFQFCAYYTLMLGYLRYSHHDFKDHWVAGFYCIFILAIMFYLAHDANYLNGRLAIISLNATFFSLIILFIIAKFYQAPLPLKATLIGGFTIHSVFSFLKTIASVLDQNRSTIFDLTFISRLTFMEYVAIFLFWIASTFVLIHHKNKAN